MQIFTSIYLLQWLFIEKVIYLRIEAPNGKEFPNIVIMEKSYHEFIKNKVRQSSIWTSNENKSGENKD